MGDTYLVSCVSQKLDRPAPARDLYQSAWFVKARAYVESKNADWFILSAKHGLVHPEKITAPYEMSLNTMGIALRRQWSSQVMSQLNAKFGEEDSVLVLAGQRYREFLMEPLSHLVRRVDVPMLGLAIGKQLKWLKTNTGDR